MIYDVNDTGARTLAEVVELLDATEREWRQRFRRSRPGEVFVVTCLVAALKARIELLRRCDPEIAEHIRSRAIDARMADDLTELARESYRVERAIALAERQRRGRKPRGGAA